MNSFVGAKDKMECKSTAGGLQDKGTVDCWFATKINLANLMFQVG
jgi:hypothetical protein